jgi:hypothetical protein
MKFTYILGNPRSGTSLFRLMLNAHPRVVAPPECGFIQWNFSSFSSADFSDSHQRSLFADAVLASKKMETWGLQKEQLLEAFNQVSSPNYQSLCEAVFSAYASSSSQEEQPEVAIDKNNYYLDYLEEINRAMPHASYLHLVRDVRDVAVSYLEIQRKKHKGEYAPKLATTAEEIAESWCENNERTTAFLADKKHLIVRYEDLLVRPEIELARVASFLGISYDERMTRYYEFNDEPEETLGWKQKTLQPVDASRAGAFRRELDPNFGDKLWELAEETLVKFGYTY